MKKKWIGTLAKVPIKKKIKKKSFETLFNVSLKNMKNKKIGTLANVPIKKKWKKKYRNVKKRFVKNKKKSER